MDYIVRPKIIVRDAGQAAAGQESPEDRLLKYIPLTIVGAYPLLENAIAQYATTPLPHLSLRGYEWIIFFALILYYVLFLNSKFNKKADLKGWLRVRLQAIQTVVSIAAFIVWTYSIKSAIWSDWYNAGVAIGAAVIFTLFASLYAPPVELNDARNAKLL